MVDTLRYPRTSRLTCKAQFDPVFSKGIRRKSKYFTALVLKNTEAVARLGTVVSRKVSPLAVRRNLIKRQLREQFRLHQAQLSGFDIVALPQKQAANCSANELHQDLQTLFAQIQRLPQTSNNGTMPPS